MKLARRFEILLAGLVLATRVGKADPDFAVAQSGLVTNEYTAYAQVEPIAWLPMRADHSGVVEELAVLPGNSIQAGQKIGVLGGPEIKASLAQDEAWVSNALTNLPEARKFVAVEQRQFASHLVTRRAVFQAESALAQARRALDTAQTRLAVLQQATTMRAPVSGMVTAISAADGERVNAGDTILTIQPSGKIWLRAVYYGNDIASIKPGMTGKFFPAGRNNSVPVKVCSVLGAVTPEGGESVGLLPVGAPNWLNGQSGTVILEGSVQRQAAIPTESLILDQGLWWVLVHTDNGDKPQVVVPGQSRGWRTFIKEGLQPGDQVVTEGAYLKFHEGISKSYQPPD
ncbi:MAG: efflux RND transporter periplasmic adaptor subunit [Limisphaerales bacterium]